MGVTLWKTNSLLLKITMFNEKIHYLFLSPFSIAMLVYQRVIRTVSSGNVDGNIDAILMFITKKKLECLLVYHRICHRKIIYKWVYVMGKSSIYGKL